MEIITLKWEKDSLKDDVEGNDHFWLDIDDCEDHIEKNEDGKYVIVSGGGCSCSSCYSEPYKDLEEIRDEFEKRAISHLIDCLYEEEKIRITIIRTSINKEFSR